ncbi:MAG: AAA family ATPase [Rikenellaceae bacterium]
MLLSNPQIELANDFLRSTGANIFLTGKAGTGKTTFLHTIVQSIEKRVVVAAPTGVAAINARGVTLHSLFQLPFGPNIPEAQLQSRDFAYRKIGRKKLALIRSIELLVIDEISMVRCDLLDAVDETLRRVRRNSAPFGGVQLLMIGDVEQLSPICRDDEWQLLSAHYASPYFFSSKVLQQCPYITIELKEIFRQRDPQFTQLLNAVRENKITREVVDRLNSRYIASFEPRDDEGYITLTTHNATANSINQAALSRLATPSFCFEATVRGDYPEGSYPNDYELELKVGAQVIFIKNDISPEKLYYNGLIGRITQIEDNTITVQPDSGAAAIVLSQVTWENIEYKINDQTSEIEESVKGTFSQIPLRCAWAITIHKSQGLSFDKAIIDAGKSFAHGQVYVALSRCRRFEGVVLRTPLSGGSIIRDNTIEGFTELFESQRVDRVELERHRREYYHNLLSEIFDFEELNRQAYSLSRLLNASLYREYPQLCGSFHQTTQSLNAELQRVGNGFKQQLSRAIFGREEYLSDPFIAERLVKAADYFASQLQPIGELIEEAASVKTDIKDVAKRLKTLTAELREQFSIKQAALKLCAEGFSCEAYLKAKFAIITQPETTQGKEPKKAKSAAKSISSDIVNEELFEALRAWRADEASSNDKPAYTVLTNRTLIEVQAVCPMTIEELKGVVGMGPVKLQKYGDQLLEIVKEYIQPSHRDE